MAKRAQADLPARERIVRAAVQLLSRGGRDAVSTRAVSAAAGVQAPAIYRQFGDMGGLLDAAAREVLAAYVRQKSRREPSDDALDDLRRGWDEHVAFGLANPAAFAILYGGGAADAEPGASREGYAILEQLVRRLADEGRLRGTVASAARLVHAGGSGVTLTLLATEPAERDPHLSTAMREAVLAAISPGSVGAAPRSPGR
ncbi:MAG: tetR, partial [Labilithrix sp.]|nr:tetR [Labilithrix sp.]